MATWTAPGTFPAQLELRAEDGLTRKERVEGLDIEQTKMANTLRRMERDGLATDERRRFTSSMSDRSG